MRIILAPDSFKGTFSSLELIAMLEQGCRQHFPMAEVISLPMADGGEGTVDAFAAAGEYRRLTFTATGPLGSPVQASLALKDDTAVIEMAQASGLGLLREDPLNPMEASTAGTGEMIRRALDEGARRLLIGLGGSATNDGGMGMLQALGAVFTDSAGRVLKAGGQALGSIHTIDVSGLDSRLKACAITAMCDVTNPLTGPLGATRIYGPQKGADAETVEALERGMLHYRQLLTALTGTDPDTLPGSGAAGGMGAAVALVLGGTLKPGIQAILDHADFDALARTATFLITGEGRLDEQSAFGKVPYGIAERCRNHRLKVFVLAGSVSGDTSGHYSAGIHGIYPVVTGPCTLEEALNEPHEKMRRAIDGMLRFIKAGQELAE